MDKNKQGFSGFLLSFICLSLILATGPYLTLKTAPALGTFLRLMP